MTQSSCETLIFSVHKLRNIKFNELYQNNSDSFKNLNILESVIVSVQSAISNADMFTYNSVIFQSDRTLLQELQRNPFISCGVMKVLLNYAANGMVSEQTQEECYKSVLQLAIMFLEFPLEFQTIIQKHYEEIYSKIKLKNKHCNSVVKYEKIFLTEMKKKFPETLFSEIRFEINTNSCTNSQFWTNDLIGKEFYFNYGNMHNILKCELIVQNYMSWLKRRFIAKDLNEHQIFKNLHKMRYLFKLALKITNRLINLIFDSNNLMNSLENLFRLLANIQIRFAGLDEFYIGETIARMINAMSDHVENYFPNKMRCGKLIGYSIKLGVVALCSHSYQKSYIETITKFFRKTLTHITNNILKRYTNKQSIVLYKQYIKLCCHGVEVDKMYFDSQTHQLHNNIIDMELADTNFGVYRSCLHFCTAIIKSPFRNEVNLIIMNIQKMIANIPQQIANNNKSKLSSLLFKIAVQCIWKDESIIDGISNIIEFLSTIISEFGSEGVIAENEDLILNLVIAIEKVMRVTQVSCKVLVDTIIKEILKLKKYKREIYIQNLILRLECMSELLANISSNQQIDVIIQHGLQFIKLLIGGDSNTTRDEEYSIILSIIARKYLNDKNIECIQLANITCKRLVQHHSQDGKMVKQLFYYLIKNSYTSVIRDIYINYELILGNKSLWGFHTFLYTYRGTREGDLLIGISKIFTDTLVLLNWAFQTENSLEAQLAKDYSFQKADNFRNGSLIKGLRVSIIKTFSGLLKKEHDISLFEHFYDKLLTILFAAVIFPNSISLLKFSKRTLRGITSNMKNSLGKHNNSIIQSVMKRLISINSLVSYKLEGDLIKMLKRSLILSDAISIITNFDVFRLPGIEKSLDIPTNILNNFGERLKQVKNRESQGSNLHARNSFMMMLGSHVEIICTAEYRNCENQKQEESTKFLISHYRNYVSILKALGVGAIWFSNKKLNIFDILTSDLTFYEAKARIMYVKQKVLSLLEKCENQLYKRKIIQTCQISEYIDLFISKSKSSSTINKTSLHESEANIKLQLFISFSDCMSIFNNADTNSPLKEIYLSDEDILEIAIRNDRGIVLISDCRDGICIESNVLYFMNEGVYISKSSRVEVGLNTTNIWKKLILKVFSENKQVTAIIIPKGHPNIETWKELRKIYEPEVLTSLLTRSKDYQYSWKTYEARPRKINGGKDIVLKPGILVPTQYDMVSLQRDELNTTLDFTSIISNHILKCLAEKYHSSIYAQRQVIIKYIANKVQTIKFSQEKYNCIEKLESSSFTFQSLFSHLARDINCIFENWILTTDLKTQFTQDNNAFFELKNYLETSNTKNNDKYNQIRSQIKSLINNSLFLFKFTDLPKEVQFQIMHWIDQLESELWVETESTEKAYISLLTNSESLSKEPFPGYVYFFLPEYAIKKRVPKTLNVLTCDRMTAYIIGQNIYLDLSDDPLKNSNFRKDNWKLGQKNLVYEVLGTWVSPKFRKLNISLEIYRKIFLHAPSNYVVLDAIQDTHGKLSIQRRLGIVLNWFKLNDLILNQVIMREVYSTWNTYLVKDDRKFKRFLVNLTTLRVLIRIDDICNIFSNVTSQIKSVFRSTNTYITLLFLFIIYFVPEKINII